MLHSFEARNQRYFYIDFTHQHLSFQLCVAFVNLPNPLVLYWCVDLEIEALNKNIGRWETTWFNFHILHLICFNLVGYNLYQIWRRCRGPIFLFKVKFSVCLCSVFWYVCVVQVWLSWYMLIVVMFLCVFVWCACYLCSVVNSVAARMNNVI